LKQRLQYRAEPENSQVETSVFLTIISGPAGGREKHGAGCLILVRNWSYPLQLMKKTSHSNARTSSAIEALAPAQFTQAVVATLAPLADPVLRPWMQAYMRGRFVFLGIKTPARRAALAPLVQSQKNATGADLLRMARALWALPEREYQYAAVDLLGKHVRRLTPDDIPALLALVKRKSWWDTVDALASVVNRILQKADPGLQSMMDEAVRSDNFWIRRIAILHQLAWRERTDTERLFHYAVACAHEKEFFIRKAIGWALRDYARHAPKEVRVFLVKHKAVLSPLTVREAGKHI
jgi:3-methyladenine DNA glycosylase AlkD